MAFGSGDYLYCSHRTCRRRFCSEGALDKHYGSFHGRPTCETCGKKLKKSGKVRLPFISPTFRQPEPTNLVLRVDSIRARCWIQVRSSKITPRSTLFPTPTTLATITIPRMLRYVQLARRTTRAANLSHLRRDSMLTFPSHPRSLPRISRGSALFLLPSTLMVSIAPNSLIPHWDLSAMTTTARAAAHRRSRMT